MRRFKETTYGRKGGEGITKGKTAIKYEAVGPDGKTYVKRTYFPPKHPVLNFYQHKDIWYVAGVNERDDPRMIDYIQIDAKIRS